MSFPRTALHIGVLALFAFAGGFAAQALFGAQKAEAQYELQVTDQTTGATIQQMPTAAVNFLELKDQKNRKGYNAYVMDGQPGIVFYGEEGNMRMQQGTYTDKGERGMPFMSLNDKRGRVRMLFRLYGENESPVIIFKDNAGRDRMVLGLALKGPDQEPFLATKDKSAKGIDFIGEYFTPKKK